MGNERQYWVYILASFSKTLYIGMTSNITRRLAQHRDPGTEGFTQKYRIHRLVYCEAYVSGRAAIAREKQLKAWRREKKLALIESANPGWADLSEMD